MAANLLVAAILDVLTFLIHGAGLIGITSAITILTEHRLVKGRMGDKVFALAVLGLGIFVLICVETSVWAGGLVWLGVFDDFPTAFYFSTSAFATTGFSDVMPAPEWRLLGALEGVTGFLVMGWSAAYLVTSGLRFGPFEREKHF